MTWFQCGYMQARIQAKQLIVIWSTRTSSSPCNSWDLRVCVSIPLDSWYSAKYINIFMLNVADNLLYLLLFFSYINKYSKLKTEWSSYMQVGKNIRLRRIGKGRKGLGQQFLPFPLYRFRKGGGAWGVRKKKLGAVWTGCLNPGN